MAGIQVGGILFDLDGTLLDTGPLIAASFRYSTRKVLGEVIPDEVLLEKVGQPLRVQMEDLAPDRVDELLTVYRAYNEENHDAMVSEFAGVHEMLDIFNERDLPLGVVTSKMGKLARRGLSLFGYDPYFRCIIAADDCLKHKPDPAPVLAGARSLCLEPGQCAYVGDSPYDIQAGNAAGAATVAVTWGMFPIDRLLEQNPTYVVETPDDIVKLFG